MFRPGAPDCLPSASPREKERGPLLQSSPSFLEHEHTCVLAEGHVLPCLSYSRLFLGDTLLSPSLNHLCPKLMFPLEKWPREDHRDWGVVSSGTP